MALQRKAGTILQAPAKAADSCIMTTTAPISDNKNAQQKQEIFSRETYWSLHIILGITAGNHISSPARLVLAALAYHTHQARTAP
jgi:hypothetical protein